MEVVSYTVGIVTSPAMWIVVIIAGTWNIQCLVWMCEIRLEWFAH
jgi:hypothetical protein